MMVNGMSDLRSADVPVTPLADGARLATDPGSGYSPPVPGPSKRFPDKLQVPVTAEQFKAVRAAAARSGESMSSFARRALLAAIEALGITVPPARLASGTRPRARRRGGR